MLSIFEDCAFAAIAAIGFGSISNVPYKSFSGCALLAAAGHGMRTLLMSHYGMGIIPASFAGALVIGILSILAASHYRTPAESMSFPALLPMIPGMYAYRTVQALLLCVQNQEETAFLHYLYQLAYNGFVCTIVIILMFLGVTVPIFALGKYAFSATR